MFRIASFRTPQLPACSPNRSTVSSTACTIVSPGIAKTNAFRSPKSSAVSISFVSLARKSSIAKVHRFAYSLTSAAPILRSSQKSSPRNLRDIRKEFPTEFAHSDAVPQVALPHHIDAGKDALTLPDRQASRSRGELRSRFSLPRRSCCGDVSYQPVPGIVMTDGPVMVLNPWLFFEPIQ